MGCGASSKAVSVIEVEPCKKASNNEQIFDRKTSPICNRDPIKLIPLPVKKNTSAGTYDSGINSNLFDSEDDSIQERRSMSSDSISDSDEIACRNVITENSKRELVEKIESEFIERNDLDLAVNGFSCPPLLSEKEKQMINLREEEKSLEMLKSNGLVPKPVVLNENYALFEIVEEKKTILQKPSDAAFRGPPSRLASIREKPKPTLTVEEIQEKLEKANQRKKESLKMKAVSGSISLEEKREEKKIHVKSINNETQDRELLERQERLKELRDKLKAKNSEIMTPRTPRSKELLNELDKFRPKTSSNFRHEF